MNNDLAQFSEERLKDLMNVSMDINVRFSDADIIALARIALAAKQAKPVAQVYQPANVGICAALGVLMNHVVNLSALLRQVCNNHD